MKKGYDLTHIGEKYYNVAWDCLKEEVKNNENKEEYEENCFSVSYEDIEDFSFINYDYDYEFDEYEYEDFIEELFKDYPYYLRVAFNSTWNNTSGYNITHEKKDLLYFSYDTTQYFQAQSKHRKSMYFRIHSHDCPMGHDYIVIGLTYTEHEMLEDRDIDFIFNWAKKKTKKLIEDGIK